MTWDFNFDKSSMENIVIRKNNFANSENEISTILEDVQRRYDNCNTCEYHTSNKKPVLLNFPYFDKVFLTNFYIEENIAVKIRGLVLKNVLTMRYLDRSIKSCYFSDKQEDRFDLVMVWILKHADAFKKIIEFQKNDHDVSPNHVTSCRTNQVLDIRHSCDICMRMNIQ